MENQMDDRRRRRGPLIGLCIVAITVLVALFRWSRPEERETLDFLVQAVSLVLVVWGILVHER